MAQYHQGSYWESLVVEYFFKGQALWNCSLGFFWKVSFGVELKRRAVLTFGSLDVARAFRLVDRPAGRVEVVWPSIKQKTMRSKLLFTMIATTLSRDVPHIVRMPRHRK